jgi:hypothetical protein
MPTNVKKEITLVTDIGALAMNYASVEATSDNPEFNKYFKIEAWINAIASPMCKSYSYLVNTVTAEGAPVIISMTPNNPAAANVFKRLYDELAELVIVNIQHSVFIMNDGITCHKPALILSQLGPHKPGYINYLDASASLYLMADVPGGFYIETVTDGAYLHIPGTHGVEQWSGTDDGLVLECYSARDLDNMRVSKILLTAESVCGVVYVPEKQLKYLDTMPELFEHVGKGSYDLLSLFSPGYEEIKVLVPVSFQEQPQPMQRYYGPSPMVGDPVPGLNPYFNSAGPQANYADPQSVWPYDRTVAVWNTKTNSRETLQVPKGTSIAEHIQGCPEISVLPPHLKITNVSYETQY